MLLLAPFTSKLVTYSRHSETLNWFMVQSRYLKEDKGKNFKISHMQKDFSKRSNIWLKIIFCLMSAVELVGVKI